MKKSKLIFIGLITLIGFPLIGFVVNFFFGANSFVEVMDLENWSYWKSLLGIIHGVVFGIIALKISSSKLIEDATKKYKSMVDDMEINWFYAIFLSVCAGLGEEVFFRGVLQEYTGIWITAIVFVAIHGYLNPKNWKLSIYGVFLVLYSAMLGFFKEEISIWFSIYSHLFFDLVLFISLKTVSTSY